MRSETYAGKCKRIQFVHHKREIAIVVRNVNLVVSGNVGNGYVGNDNLGTVGIVNNTTKLNQRLFRLLGKGAGSKKNKQYADKIFHVIIGFYALFILPCNKMVSKILNKNNYSPLKPAEFNNP